MTKQQNQWLGWALLSLLMLGYFRYVAPAPKVEEGDAAVAVERVEEVTPMGVLKRGLVRRSDGEVVVLANDVMEVTFSRWGGQVQKVVLKKYRNYDGSPLVVLDEGSRLDMVVPMEGGVVHTQGCLFEVVPSVEEGGDDSTLVLVHRLPGGEGRYIRHTFGLEEGRYQVKCRVEVGGGEPLGEGEASLVWYQPLRRLEKDAGLGRKEATLYYYRADARKVTYLSATKTKAQTKRLKEAVGWVSANQKFFSAAVASAVPFRGATLLSSPCEGGEDPDLLKEVGMSLTLDAGVLREGAVLDFYFGPSEYRALRGVAPGFEENHYLGITPFKQINKYFILPMTYWLEDYVDHYLLILLILLLILALLQLPLSYQGYLLEVKQRALAPLVVAIKERYADDPIQAQVKENELKTRAGLSMAGPLLMGLLQIPIFLSVMNFVKYSEGFRLASFLWMEDLSTYDSFVKLPFRVPLLGSHVSLVALLASCVMMVPSLLKSEKEKVAEGKMVQYVVPVMLFFALNSYSAAFNVYRMLSQLVNLVPKLFFRWVVDSEGIEREVLARLAKREAGATRPRAQKRLAKRNQKHRGENKNPTT